MSESLRERKKAETRTAIAHAALDLFGERGYDTVALADVALRANVGQRTIFRYFGEKEELLFGEDDAVLATLDQALDNRPADEPAAVALLEALVVLCARWADRRDEGRDRQRIIATSPALQARERGKHARYEEALAGRLRQRGLDDGSARVLVRAGIACQHEATLRWFDDKDPRNPGLERRCRQTFTQLAATLAAVPSRGRHQARRPRPAR